MVKSKQYQLYKTIIKCLIVGLKINVNQNSMSDIKIDISQWNRIESPKINLLIYCQKIFKKELKRCNGGKDSFFNTWCCKN